MWFWYALLSAVVSAVSVILNKRALNKIGAPLVTWALFAFSIPFLIIPSFYHGFPKINQLFIVAVVGSSIIFTIGKTMNLDSLKKGFLSQVFPLTPFNSLFTYIFGLIFLSEILRLIPIIGLLFIILGGYILNADEAREDLLKPLKLLITNRISLIFLSALILFSLSAILDKIGLTNIHPQNPYFVLLSENIIMTLLLTGYMTHRDRRWIYELKHNFGLLLVNGLIYTVLALLVFYGFQSGPVALVGGVKKLEVMFVLLLSYFFFHDRPTKHAWIGSLIMLMGVLLIKVG